MSGMPLIIQKKSSSISLDLENKLVEHFKKAIYVSNQDLYTKVNNIDNGMTQILQAIEKLDKTMQEMMSKLDKHSNQLDYLKSEQLKLKSQLKQPRADSEDTSYVSSYQHKGAHVDRGGYRGRNQEYRGGSQQSHHSNYDQGYQQDFDTRHQRPQNDSSPRYLPEFEPNHRFESKHSNPGYHYSSKKFDSNGFGSIQNDTVSTNNEQEHRSSRFQPNFFGKKQQSFKNYNDNERTQQDFEQGFEHEKKNEFSSLSTKPNKFSSNKGGFGHKAQQNSEFGSQSSIQPIHSKFDDNWENEQTPVNNWDIYSEKSENKENEDSQFSSRPVPPASQADSSIKSQLTGGFGRPNVSGGFGFPSVIYEPKKEQNSTSTTGVTVESISEDIDPNQSVQADLIQSEDAKENNEAVSKLSRF